MDKEIQEKVIIATARKFKDEGECDIWHTIWHDGVPYDMHLMLDQSLEDKNGSMKCLSIPSSKMKTASGHAVLLTILSIAIYFYLNTPFQTEENGDEKSLGI